MEKIKLAQSIEIGRADIALLDAEEQQRFYFGMIDLCKKFFQDPTNLAEYHAWQQNQKLKGNQKQ